MPIFVTILKPGCLLTCMKYYTSLTFMPPQAMRSGGCLFRRPDVLYFGLVRRVGQAKPLWSHVFFSWLSYYFCRVMRCISAAYAVTRCLSVCPCVKVKVKVKEVDLYSAFIVVPHTLGAQVRITQCYLQVTPYLPLPRKHSPDAASPDWGCGHLIAAYYSVIYPQKDERLSRPGWLTYSGRFTHISLTRQPQVERRTAKVHLSEIDVLPLCHATNLTG